MTFSCPKCPATFGDDSFAFRAHLRGCDGGPHRKPAETQEQRDARMLADAELSEQDFTNYEQSLWNSGNRRGAIEAQKRRLRWANKTKAGGEK